MVNIPYKGGGPGVLFLIGGEVQLMFPSAGAAVRYIKSGMLRALAVTSAQPSALVPGVPTLAATLPGYESVSLTGLFAPAKTPTAIITRLNQEIVRVLNRTDVMERFRDSGAEATGSAPEQFAAIIKSEMARMSKIIKDAGIKVD